MAFEQVVATPNFGLAVAPAVDTSWLANLPNTYFQGQTQQRQLAVANAFKDGLPQTNGQPDFVAAADKLYRLGALDQAGSLLNTGIQMQQLRGAMTPSPAWGGGGADPAASTSGAPNVSGANPAVVGYIRSRASSLGMDPDKAVKVAASEGLNIFDPSRPGTAVGDNNSSFGPFQLHYGGVAGGGNSGSGLGDEFTKATGLDARDPSTWQQQVDFALKNASQNGWGAFHGAANSGIGNWDGIRTAGGPNLTVHAQSAAPQGAPASASNAVNPMPGNVPYRVASNAPVAAPQGQAAPVAAPVAAPSAPAAPAGHVIGAPQASPVPTANTPTSSFASIDYIARKANRDPQQVADVLGVDPSEEIDAADPGVRATLASVFAKVKPVAPYATAGATPLANSDGHPFGPKPAPPVAAPMPAPVPAQPMASALQSTPQAVQSTPQSVTPPPQHQPQPQAPVPQAANGPASNALSNAMQSPLWAKMMYFRQEASRYGFMGPNGKIQAEQLGKTADAIENAIARGDIPSPLLKEWQNSGFQGSLLDYIGAKASAEATATAQGKLDVETSPEAIRGAAQKAQAEADVKNNSDIEQALNKARVADVVTAIEGVQPARQKLQTLSLLSDAWDHGDNISTGPGAETALKLKQVANNLGINVEGLPQTEIVQKLGAQLASQASKGLSPRPTQFDFKTFLNNNPGLLISPQGNKALISVLQQQAQHEIALGNLARQQKNGDGWDETVAKFDKEHPIVSPLNNKPLDQNAVIYPAAPKAPVTATPPQVGAVMQGYRFKGGDPSIPASWEQVP